MKKFLFVLGIVLILCLVVVVSISTASMDTARGCKGKKCPTATVTMFPVRPTMPPRETREPLPTRSRPVDCSGLTSRPAIRACVEGRLTLTPSPTASQ